MKTPKLLLSLLSLFSLILFLISCNDDDNVENTAPEIQNEIFSIDENPTEDTLITLTATDADQDSLVFSIVSQTPTGATSINSSTGVLSIADASAFDYETNTQIIVNVSVTDGIDSANATVTINLNDVVDLNPIIANQSFSVDEGALNLTEIGDVVASDPQNLSLTYVIVSESVNGAFNIGSTDGKLSVNEEFPFDFETNTSLSVTVRVSNGTLDTDAVITVNINDLDYPKVGLRAGYLFDDTGNSIATDVTGNYNGEIIGNVNLSTDRNGDSDKAFQFNTSRVKIEEQAMNGMTNFSISGWAKADNSVDGTIFIKGPTQSTNVELVGYLSNDVLALRYIDPVTDLYNPVELTSGPPANQWFHFTIVVENLTTWSLYIDGQLSGSQQFTNAMVWGNGNINIGANGNTTYWLGSIDDVLIYDRVLTATEITSLATDSY